MAEGKESNYGPKIGGILYDHAWRKTGTQFPDLEPVNEFLNRTRI